MSWNVHVHWLRNDEMSKVRFFREQIIEFWKDIQDPGLYDCFYEDVVEVLPF